MKIKKGTTRIVIILGCLVIKFPIIEIIGSFEELYYARIIAFESIKKNGLKKHHLIKLIRRKKSLKSSRENIIARSKEIDLEVIPFKSYEIMGIRYNLFRGIMANWNEYCFYRKTKNLFVMPTYFSLFGLINIQKRGQEISFWNRSDIWEYICRNSISPNQVFCNSHSFRRKENFCLDGDKIKMLDYGNRHVHKFLELNGENLFKNFVKPPV